MGAKTSRNAACPCGSGRKFKRCCDGKEAVFEELLALGSLFPRLRPRDPELESWLDERAPAEPTRELVNEAIERISAEDRGRMVACYADGYPEVWRQLVAAIGEEPAATLLGMGAVVAALREERRLWSGDLGLIEDVSELRDDPLDVLALVLEPCDLWSLVEATEAAAALAGASPSRYGEAIAAEASSRWTDDHRARLDFLVERVRRQLPVAGWPHASAALAAACDAYANDPRVRDTLPALLLEDALPVADLFVALAA